jgi:hypothetical protein
MELLPDGSFCIGLTEPAFVASISTGTATALGLGAGLRRLHRSAAGAAMDPQVRNLLWLAALVAVTVGPLLLQQRLFAWRYPQLTLCTTIVGPYFAMPAISLFAGGLLFSVWTRRHPLAAPKQ